MEPFKQKTFSKSSSSKMNLFLLKVLTGPLPQKAPNHCDPETAIRAPSNKGVNRSIIHLGAKPKKLKVHLIKKINALVSSGETIINLSISDDSV